MQGIRKIFSPFFLAICDKQKGNLFTEFVPQEILLSYMGNSTRKSFQLLPLLPRSDNMDTVSILPSELQFEPV